MKLTSLALLACAVPAVVPAQLTLAPNAPRAGQSRQGPFGFFDAPRGRITLVGGTSFGGAFESALQQYEGYDGFELASPSPLPARAFGATAVDGDGTVLLFGGLNTDGSRSDETWQWDSALPGTVPITGLITRPAPRARTAMALHRGRRVLVLFGGEDARGEFADTWIWRSGSWNLAAPTASPSARSGHAMAFDPASGSVLLFGGQSQGVRLADTWSFDGENWTQLAIAGPRARFGHAMALDEARREVVLVGGDLGGTFDAGETWALQQGAWQQRAATTGILSVSQGVLVFDARRRQLVLTGGRYNTPFGWSPNNGTRMWDGTAWNGLAGYGGVVADPEPTLRLDYMAAFDQSRGRYTMFGGRDITSGVVLAETWEYGDGTWALRTPPQAPSARRFGAMAWTPSGSYLFGGENALGTIASDDLWRWDGSNWTIAPTTGARPSRRTFTTMAFDPLRNRLVLYGGLDQSFVTFGDVWEYDLASQAWVRGAGTPPSARLSPAIAWDSARGRVQLHGGQLPGVVLSREFWEYDGSVWSLRHNTGPAFEGHSMAFDAARGRMVIVGDPQAVWEFNGSNWQSFGSGPFIGPVMVYDTERRQCAAVAAYAASSGVLAWNGATWSSLAAPTLGARSGHTLTFDPVRRVDVLLGGVGNGTTTGDWWDWDGGSWRRTLPMHRLPPRQDHAACWLPAEGKVLVFGGRDASSARRGDTWLLDAASRDWLAVPGSGPSARSRHAMCVEESTGRAVLFGGDDGSAANDTWTFTRAAGWTSATAFVRPPARSAHAMAWHAPSGSVIMFGGSGTAGLTNDTWRFSSASGWSRVTTANVPPARQGHTLTFDPSRGRLVLYGGLGSGLVTLSDVWEYDGSDWTLRVPETTAPPALVNHAACFDAARGRVLLSSGATHHMLWSNVSPAGVGDPVAPVPLTYKTQPVVGNVFRLTFPVNSVGLLYLSVGPATTPLLLLPPPIACRNQRLFVDLRLYVPTATPEVDLAIPADPSFVGVPITFQALTFSGGCVTATDALNAVLLAR